jgi:dCMP deaminase
MDRLTREYIHMHTAVMWGQRSLCSLPDRKIGCVITSPDMRQILAFGYNGPARGLPDTWCEEFRKRPDCNIGDNSMSRCPCLHAEENAIALVDGRMPGKIMFVTMTPCLHCSQLIVNANIGKVFYLKDYRNTEGIELLKTCRVDVRKVPNYPSATS